MIAIDPGDKHCGVAVFDEATGDCVKAGTFSPPALIERLERTKHGVWVVEEFKLYPWKARQQAYSQMLTAQLIGVITYLAEKGDHDLYMQSASVKKIAMGHLRATRAGVLLPGDTHSHDAQLHGWYYLMKIRGVMFT